jgi:hypothetical protein
MTTIEVESVAVVRDLLLRGVVHHSTPLKMTERIVSRIDTEEQ